MRRVAAWFPKALVVTDWQLVIDSSAHQALIRRSFLDLDSFESVLRWSLGYSGDNVFKWNQLSAYVDKGAFLGYLEGYFESLFHLTAMWLSLPEEAMALVIPFPGELPALAENPEDEAVMARWYAEEFLPAEVVERIPVVSKIDSGLARDLLVRAAYYGMKERFSGKEFDQRRSFILESLAEQILFNFYDWLVGPVVNSEGELAASYSELRDSPITPYQLEMQRLRLAVYAREPLRSDSSLSELRLSLGLPGLETRQALRTREILENHGNRFLGAGQVMAGLWYRVYRWPASRGEVSVHTLFVHFDQRFGNTYGMLMVVPDEFYDEAYLVEHLNSTALVPEGEGNILASLETAADTGVWMMIDVEGKVQLGKSRDDDRLRVELVDRPLEEYLFWYGFSQWVSEHTRWVDSS